MYRLFLNSFIFNTAPIYKTDSPCKSKVVITTCIGLSLTLTKELIDD